MFKAVVVLTLLFTNSFAEGFYKKGVFVALEKVEEHGSTIRYKDIKGELYTISNGLILKTLSDYTPKYFETQYGLKKLKSYGDVIYFEVDDVSNVLPLCQRIYENEAVKYVQPSFVKKVHSNTTKFETFKKASHPLQRRIISQANENTKEMLDSENTVNYYKYYDDVFRYEDESFWHLYNKGGFITQAYYQGEYYDVLSKEDVDTNALEVIDSGITGKGVKVVVVDSAFELTHPDLSFSDSYNFYLHNHDITPNTTADFHGTAVAGVIGAHRGNNYATMGVAPDAYLIGFNGLFEIEDDVIFSQSYIDIFYKALELNADIVNCSWTTVGSVDEASEDAINTFVQETRDGKGGFVVFSSGNEGSTSLLSEAALESVISVGAIEADGSRSLYSNYGNKLDLVAPSNFVSIDLNGENGFSENEMGFVAGTSFAAPVVSSVIALILESNPDLTREQLLEVLYSTTKKVGDTLYAYNIEESLLNTRYSKSKTHGYGLVDAKSAVEKAKLYQSVEHNNSNEQSPLLDNLKEGWNLVSTDRDIVDMSLFDDAEIIWSYVDGEWRGFSSKLTYAKVLRQEEKLLTSLKSGSAIWVYKGDL